MNQIEHNIDNQNTTLYTHEYLERVAKLAAETAIKKVLSSMQNLDNPIMKEACSSEKDEGVFLMPSSYNEVYSYIDNNGTLCKVRLYGKTKKETNEKFQTFLVDLQKKSSSPTLREYIDERYRKSFIDSLSATTRSNYNRYLKLYILPFMGNEKMSDITLSTIQSFYDWLANASSHGAKSDINKRSIDRIGGFLSRVLSIAEEMNVIKESPFKAKLLRNNGKPSGHHKALPDGEVDRIKRSIPLLQDERERLFMGLLVYTGLRREEILGLQWEHIDMNAGCGFVKTVVVYPETKKAVIKDVPKTKYSDRPFIIPQPLKDIISNVSCKNGFLIHGRNCMQPISLSTFQRTYRSVFKRLGISDYNNHDWRTTFGTQLKEAGMTSAQVADIMGHADTRMVETVYARTRYEGVIKHKDALEELNKKYVCGPLMLPEASCNR